MTETEKFYMDFHGILQKDIDNEILGFEEIEMIHINATMLEKYHVKQLSESSQTETKLLKETIPKLDTILQEYIAIEQTNIYSDPNQRSRKQTQDKRDNLIDIRKNLKRIYGGT